MLRKPDTPRHILARRERSRRKRQRRRDRTRCWTVELPDAISEQCIDALVHYGRLTEAEACDHRRVAAELGGLAQRLLTWWSERWRSLDGERP